MNINVETPESGKVRNSEPKHRLNVSALKLVGWDISRLSEDKVKWEFVR